MAFPRWYFCACIALMVVCQIGVANGQFYRRVGNKKLPYTTLFVDQSGQGNFTTIQAAIDSVPSNNRYWVCIKVSAGIYRERVEIPCNKPYIILKGAAKRKTWVVSNVSDSIVHSTFTSAADNIVVKSMSFVNSYNGAHRAPAVAARIEGDKSAFYRCGFFGLQDTLWDFQGRHYYKKCTIQGAVDFIFGSGRTLFEKSLISFNGAAIEPGPGYITAQGRDSLDNANGFVFKECVVNGTGKAYLGRPWRNYSTVIFYNSQFSNIVQPEGWNPWNSVGKEYELTFVEHGCYGPGANTSQRVSWLKKLSPAELEQYTSLSYIDNEGWLNEQPF